MNKLFLLSAVLCLLLEPGVAEDKVGATGLKKAVIDLDFVSTHTHIVDDIPLTISSPLFRIETR